MLRAIGGVVLGGSLAGCLGGGNGSASGLDEAESVPDDEVPTYDGWLDDVPNYEGTADLRGEGEVTVEVGTGNDGLRFTPPAVLVDPGTDVVWEWTGQGGGHNVVEVDGAFESEQTADAGHTFTYTFSDPGVYRYLCTPHQAQAMKGVVAVGE
ncbi:halocyanin domain-containing protein [Natronorarus salvus]|uniref:halocyanin domain-containing protein n=1 Tax=Natronorarus salvus TaxID=3117733 RepID=UPI002F26DB64